MITDDARSLKPRLAKFEIVWSETNERPAEAILLVEHDVGAEGGEGGQQPERDQDALAARADSSEKIGRGMADSSSRCRAQPEFSRWRGASGCPRGFLTMGSHAR